MYKKRIMSFIMAAVLVFGLIAGASNIAYAASERYYVVQDGDVLWRIAYAHDTTWEALAEYNGLANPHRIFPGQIIRIPTVPAEGIYRPTIQPPPEYILTRIHVVQAGETLISIANIHFVSLDDLIASNDITDAIIFVGQELKIPPVSLEDIPHTGPILIPGDNIVPDVTLPTLLFTQEDIIVGEGTQWPLGGYLTLPPGASADAPVPAIVLVHGSGAGDRNQTIFTNRPFYDIATYLSANGVAVLRYDKRTLVHGLEIIQTYGSSLTVWEETIEDAIRAADLLRADPRIDNNRIFIAGLSLGGMLAPRIHASGGDFAGLIILAGSPRNLTDIIIDQNWLSVEASHIALEQQVPIFTALVEQGDVDTLRAVFGVPAEMTDAEIMALALAQMAMLDYQIAELEAAPYTIVELAEFFATFPYMTAEEARETEIAPGAYMFAYYLRDMMLHPTPYLLQQITVPMLILHGDNDMQVFTEADFNLYKELLGYRENVTFHLYDGLNHLFMPSIATNILEMLAEYEIPSQVYAQVLADILKWILSQ